MKLFRTFLAFVVVSLVVGIGSAFNGQMNTENVVNPELNSTEFIEKETDETEETKQETQETVENEKQKEQNNSFSASNKKSNTTSDSSSNKKVETSKTTTITNQNNSKSNETPNTVNTPKVEETPKTEVVNDTASSDTQFNAMYYSITKGNPEYPTLSDCNSVGGRIKDNELNEILDWNENNPDNFKQPMIKAHWCYEVMKDGNIHYYLHLITENGVNMDEELKALYK